jgi:hypothetical protein
MSDFEYGTVEQTQQVFTGYTRKFKWMLANRGIRFSIQSQRSVEAKENSLEWDERAAAG